ncbi:chaperone protein dnaJ 20, chloroplastic-like [Salvia hispanica]|uniref:chaperone protein dnaJ 20, chloroplastic-like n=1 Tax=Salvia hispanica TaxID=49212 RepID=UPI0020092C98|nr:chaperone protein dnaJ 20, chloroplastic-like [Salvia hispanica]
MNSKMMSTSISTHIPAPALSKFKQSPKTQKMSLRVPRPRAQISGVYAPPAQTKETLYELLGIAEDVKSLSDIKKAYKQMARKYHPDVSPPDQLDEYTRRFIMVHEAYETLSDPQTRARYDRDLAFGAAFSFSPQGMEEKEEWRSSWGSQLDQLQRRNCRERSSWGARMRNSTNSFM